MVKFCENLKYNLSQEQNFWLDNLILILLRQTSIHPISSIFDIADS